MLDSFFSHFLSETNVIVLFAMLFIGTFASEDLSCVLAGTLVSTGRIGFVFAVAACFLGILVGDILLYCAGRLLGQRLLSNRFARRLVTSDQLARAGHWLERYGASAVFFSRFISGLRLPTYFAAGVLRTDFAKFGFYFAVAAIIWTPLLVGSSALFQITITGNLLLATISAVILIRFLFKLTTGRSRRLLYGKVKRVLDWEFWPVQVFYIPVIVYVFFLAARFRSVTAFTAVNPGIASSGFVGESKDDIYRLLDRSGAGKRSLRHQLIHGSFSEKEKLETANTFLTQSEFPFPLVIKPDKGERGKGIAIIKSFKDLRTLLASSERDVLIQEYCTGIEISIFYYRYPGEKRGRIFSITEKRFPKLLGDGISNLETLVLNDDRAVCMAKSYFANNHSRLNDIPASGESIKLIDIGTHSRGCVFLDGEWMRTSQLESAIDELCRSINGFYFGRFDMRAPSFDSIMKGEDLKIIELNGVTSESTNIYDPKYTLLDAYRILFRQWKIAFEIGIENIKRGHQAMLLTDFIRLILDRNKVPRPPSVSVSSIRCA